MKLLFLNTIFQIKCYQNGKHLKNKRLLSQTLDKLIFLYQVFQYTGDNFQKEDQTLSGGVHNFRVFTLELSLTTVVTTLTVTKKWEFKSKSFFDEYQKAFYSIVTSVLLCFLFNTITYHSGYNTK